ncbi:MAG TPA: hypothetical protein PK648_02950 [Verrucomicrobiales bacterium]|jgi:hypothetical protein|nr:hypothetical protein [Verrucomicrobiales bacterium]
MFTDTITCLFRSALAVAIAGLWVGGVHSQEVTSEPIEIRELKAALSLSQDQLTAEKERSAGLDLQRKELVESLSEAVRISEEQLISSRENQLKLQAFGVDLFTKEEGSLEQRLLKAVRDLDIAQQEIERQSVAIRKLSESFLTVLHAVPQLPDSERATAEKVIAEAGKLLPTDSSGENVAGEISQAHVVSIDSGIGLVVLDAGHNSGIRVGNPIAILRGDRPLYSALVVDVRESISGAVLQERMAGEGEVEVGDGIRLLPGHQTL